MKVLVSSVIIKPGYSIYSYKKEIFEDEVKWILVNATMQLNSYYIMLVLLSLSLPIYLLFNQWVRSMFHYIYWGTTTAVLTNLRRYVRQKYAIPPSECCKNSGLEELEDCCCSCWCPCFTSAQMLRHTTDYDVYPATCCTETGIPPHAPSIV